MRTPIFKASGGQHYLKGLFFEEATEPNKDYVIYTLKNYDHTVELDGKTVVLPSIQRLYLETDDPTEYDFAVKYFDGWQHWKKIKVCSWFKPVYNEMVEEMEVRIRSKALANLRHFAKNEKNAVQVNRFLLEGGWKTKDDKRGRPSKETIKQEADKLFKIDEEIKEDYGRIVLSG